MVDSRTWNNFAWKLILLPGKGSLEDVEKPNIVLSPVARVSSEYYEMRLVEEHSVAITLTWSVLFVRNINDFPDRTESK